MKSLLFAVLITAAGSAAFLASAQEGLTRAEHEWRNSAEDWYLDASFVLLAVYRYEFDAGRLRADDIVSFSRLPTQLQMDLRAVSGEYSHAVLRPYSNEIARAVRERYRQSGATLDRYANAILTAAYRRNATLYGVITGLVTDRADVPVDVMKLRIELAEALHDIQELWFVLYTQQWFR